MQVAPLNICPALGHDAALGQGKKGEQEEDVMCLAEDNAVSLICPVTQAKFTQPVQSKVSRARGCPSGPRTVEVPH